MGQVVVRLETFSKEDVPVLEVTKVDDGQIDLDDVISSEPCSLGDTKNMSEGSGRFLAQFPGHRCHHCQRIAGR